MPEGVNLWKRPALTSPSAWAFFMPKIGELMDLICYGCMVGFHEECNEPTALAYDYYTCCCWGKKPANTVIPDDAVYKRQPKDASEVRDQTSTGRKRAVVAMEEWGRGKDGSVCEWAYLRSAGGGSIPIVGCNGTILRLVKQTDEVGENESPRHIHHGPDKSTLNNASENLHAVCASCHGRWHALNDPRYEKERPDHGRPHLPINGDVLPHDPDSKATDLEKKFNDQFWSLSPAQRKTVPYREMLDGIGPLTPDTPPDAQNRPQGSLTPTGGPTDPDGV